MGHNIIKYLFCYFLQVGTLSIILFDLNIVGM